MKKVLILTYYWPPAAGPGVQRFLKMSKFLPEFGWKPYVITVKNGTYSSTDESLINDIPGEVEVYKTNTLEPFKVYEMLTGNKGSSKAVGGINLEGKQSFIKKLSLFVRANFFIPDSRKGWGKYAYKKAVEVIKKEGIDIVISTGPPHSTHLTALKLKEKHNINWVADLRDPWTNVYYNKLFPRTKLTEKKDKALEKKVSENADLISVVSNGLKEEFGKYNDNIKVLYNGFDTEDIEKNTNFKKNKKFTLSYIGNFKPNQNVVGLWNALGDICKENSNFKKDLKISLTGNADSSIIESIKDNKLNDNLEENGYVSHKKATELMNKADLLLFIIPQAENNKLIITGKLFEYIACQSPILSIGPVNGNASNILSEANRLKMSDYKDYDKIKNDIINQYKKWLESDKIIKHKEDNFMQFSRKEITKQLANQLNILSEQK